MLDVVVAEVTAPLQEVAREESSPGKVPGQSARQLPGARHRKVQGVDSLQAEAAQGPYSHPGGRTLFNCKPFYLLSYYR